MSGSINDRIEGGRRPRVHLKYKVAIDGAEEEKEIPFVMGVMADLSGRRSEPLPPLAERSFRLVDRDNFDQFLASVKPELGLRVDNRLEKDGTQLGLELKFRSMEDFGPERLVGQVEPLRKLLELRNRLADMKMRVGSSEKMDSALQDIITNTDRLKRAAAEIRRDEGAASEGGER